jgi:hypothetical protein
MNNARHVNLNILNVPRLEKNEQNFGYVGVFPPTEPMHLISTLSV